jgi:[protein-PII] uridylyltransferase
MKDQFSKGNSVTKNAAIQADRNFSSELADARQELINEFLADQRPDFMQVHTRILDDFLLARFENSLASQSMDIIRNPYVIIALGGYGRQEQCIHSDIDLLFLFKKKVPTQAEELIREVVYPLWDLGFEVGYATRDLKECTRMAADNIEILTSILDARFICGASLLYSDLLERLRKKILLRHTTPLINKLVETNAARHAHFGDSSYLLEPNLKEGQGGLRDYHTMLWLGKIKFGFKQLRDFEYYGHMSQAEYGQFFNALLFIWNVRSRLHHLTGRKCDQLHLEHQEKLAKDLGYNEHNGQKPVERFLGQLHGHMERIKLRYLLYLHEMGYPKKRGRGKKAPPEVPIEGILVRKETLNFASPETLLESPPLMIKIFEMSAKFKLPLSAEAQRLVSEFCYLADDAYRADPQIVDTFERILLAPAPVFNVLNAMLTTGLLIKLIPDFNNLVSRIQYNEYHIFSVDKHCLRTVQTLKRFSLGDDPEVDDLSAKLYRELRNRKVLLWAALLHDIGKGIPGGEHSKKGAKLARKQILAMGYDEAFAETVAALVKDHLVLIKAATRRDLNDEETAITCAHHIKKVEHLKMLYLLTVADSMATGPKAWNDWTAVLLHELFLKTLNVLEKGELASEEAVNIIVSKKRALFNAPSDVFAAKEFQTFIKSLSPRYLLATPVRLIQQHIELYGSLGDAEAVWEIRKVEGADTRTVIVCAKDRPGLFSKIAGVFTLNGVNILDAQIFTWRNNIALDIFEVKPPPDLIFENEKWARAKKNLEAALADEIDVREALQKRSEYASPRGPRIATRPNQVVIDNDTSSFFTIVEVYSYDCSGLLFRITDALFRCELDIWVAKIATQIDQALDVFYVRDLGGQKVTDQGFKEKIEATILKALPQFKQ